MFIEAVYLGSRRESTVTFVPAASTVVFSGDSMTVALRLLWVNPGAMVAADQARVTVTGKNNVGATIDVPILTITGVNQTDEIFAEEFGDVLTRQFKCQNNAALDCIVIQTILKLH